jgi:hypothetical protein
MRFCSRSWSTTPSGESAKAVWMYRVCTPKEAIRSIAAAPTAGLLLV